jgi:hypothetical protein
MRRQRRSHLLRDLGFIDRAISRSPTEDRETDKHRPATKIIQTLDHAAHRIRFVTWITDWGVSNQLLVRY